MKYNIISYLISEGIKNVFKNKKSTVSCLAIMCASMFVFGVFFVIGQNIEHIMNNVEEAQGMQVYIQKGISDFDTEKIGEKIKNVSGVKKVEFVSKDDALKQMKANLKDNADLLDGFEKNNIFPASYMVTLTNLEKNQEVQNDIKTINGVDEIKSSNQTISTLISLGKGIKIFTGSLLILLIIISIFIISNTIKLTVYARRREISIMKYVGATNGFIKIPFVIEGVFIGIISGIISVIIIGIVYSLIAKNLMNVSTIQTIGISLVPFESMFKLIFILYLALGIFIGIVGSSMSMKKYLDV